MRITTLALTAATAGIAFAQPHKHQHKHAHIHKRQVTTTEYAAEATKLAFVLNGQEITEDEACNGIENHLYEWADGSDSSGVCSTTSVVPTSTATSTSSWSATSTSVSSAAAFYQESSSAAPSAAPSSSWGSGSSWNSGSTGVDADFPDGQLDCGTFPSQYGAVPLDYLGMGGWSGLQTVTIAGGMVNNIVTGISGQNCGSASGQTMCSYACPPGYQKSQWPSTQGSTGQSVGGLSCNNGKLYLTNSALSSKLCIAGVGNVQATNNAGSVVSICRTDYPGTESETIPVGLQPGSTEQLAVPDAANYYTWQGKSTSAQYYLNPPGYGPEKACTWGDASQPLGNYAPINFGVGAKDGTTWLSIFQNAPTTTAQYPGTVELQGNLSGSCKYQNGQYCSATGCNSNGCTVSIISGTATYVVS